MKNIIIALLLVAMVSLGIVASQQKKQLAQMQVQLTEAQKQLQQTSAADEKIANAEKRAKVLQKALADSSKFAAEKTKQVEQLQKSEAAKTNSAMSGLGAMFIDDKMNLFAQENEKLDQQILARVQLILTPEQITSFQQFQASQRSLQMAGIKMAAQMSALKN